MVMLGNLSVQDMENRLGVQFPEEVREFMQGVQQQKAENIAVGKWHCFYIPFILVCGDMETAQRIHDGIKHLSSEMKQQIRIGVDQ